MKFIDGKKAIVVVAAVFAVLIFYRAFAATNIDSANRWAWNDAIGWLDFYFTDTVRVTATSTQGYASSSVGYIALHCESSPNGNVCGSSPWGVANDGGGNLSGWAWNENIGWISFASTSPVSYSVYFDGAGDFHGWAWNDIIGWISFNSLEGGGSVSYKVKTSATFSPLTAELTSSVFDTYIAGGAALNAVMWQGAQPSGTNVKFQIASGNCSNGKTNPPICDDSGVWQYKGSAGSSADYYAPSGPNVQVKIRTQDHNNARYFRYKIFLESNSGRTQTPRVDDVIVSWSP